jgi:hypothetical protein
LTFVHSEFCFVCFLRYIILAVEQMRANEKDDKKMAISCFDKIELDADKWRVGHTKA